MQITKHKVVKIDYTLTDDDGDVIDSSEGASRWSTCMAWAASCLGWKTLSKASPSAIASKSTCNRKMATANRMTTCCTKSIGANSRRSTIWNSGMQFQVDTDDGPMLVTVVEITDESVTVDGNHELAGVPLNFDVTVREIRDATPDEIAHGHAHGEGCHEH